MLPLENIGGDPKTEFLSDGVADQIINSLLQVRPPESQGPAVHFGLRGTRCRRPDLQTIARELNVQAIVTGSLHQQGDELSIGIEIVDAREDNRLWSKRYQGKLSGILDLQDQIARDVATNLRLRLTGEEEQRLTKRYTQDPTAYLLYQEGMYHWLKIQRRIRPHRHRLLSAGHQERSTVCATESLGRPCYSVRTSSGRQRDLPKRRQPIEKALEMDGSWPELTWAWATSYMFYDHNWPAAESVSEEALRLDPRSADAHHMYGYYLAATGHCRQPLPN